MLLINFQFLFILSLLFSVIIVESQQNTDEDLENPNSNSDQFVNDNEEKLLTSIFKNYNNRIRPCGPPPAKNESKGACGPTDVKVFVYLHTVDDVDDKDMNFDLQLIFRQSWTDSRLSYKQYLTDEYSPPYVTIAGDDHSYKLWLPDTFFVNEKEGYRHVIDKDNIMIRIAPDGLVTYSFRVTLTLACRMDFKFYPRDKHKCTMDISSYAHTAEHLVYHWRDTSAILMSSDFKNYVSEFEFEQVKRDICGLETTTGVYSCLRLGMHFSRVFNYAQFVHLYLLSFLLVCVSWLCFWLGTQAIITRATVGLFCFLTFIIHTSIISSNFPSASSYRAIDIWITICLIFLIAVLIQLILIYRMVRMEQRQPDQGFGIGGSGGGALMPVVTPPMYNQFSPGPHQYHFSEMERKCSIPLMMPKKSIVMPKKSVMIKQERRVSIQSEFNPPLIEEPKEPYEEDIPKRFKKPNVVVRKWRKCSKSQKFDVICRALFPLTFFLVILCYSAYY